MKKVLIVVDYQVDFVNGSLGFADAEKLDEKIAQKIQQYHTHQDTVIFTLDTHSSTYLETWEGKHLPVTHCIREEEGWRLYGQTAKMRLPEDVVLEKPTFGSLALANYLQQQQFDQVELVGLVSHICVFSNAVLAKAALPEAEIIVDAACCDSFDHDLQDKVWDILSSNYIQIRNR